MYQPKRGPFSSFESKSSSNGPNYLLTNISFFYNQICNSDQIQSQNKTDIGQNFSYAIAPFQRTNWLMYHNGNILQL